MNEKDLDNIFKDELQNAVEPTYESDWENFEKSLPSGSAGFFNRYFLIGILALITLSGMTFWVVSLSGNKESTHYSVRSAAEQTKTNTQKNTSENIRSEATVGENSNQIEKGTSSNLTRQENSEDANNHNQIKDNERDTSGLRTANASNKVEATTNTAYEVNAEQPNAAQTTNQSSELENHQNSAAQVQTMGSSLAEASANKRKDNKDANSESPENTNGKSSSGNQNSATNFNQFETTENVAEGERNVGLSSGNGKTFNETTQDISLQAEDLFFMNSLDGIIPELQTDNRNIIDVDYPGTPKSKVFETLMFVGVEQNAVLKTSPFVGVMEQAQFSRLTVGLGVGLQRSGRLNWNQESTSTTYGFTKYESGITVNTESIDLLIIPIKLGYHLNGASRVFAAYTPSIVVNARQNVQVIVDGSPDPSQSESGYKYQIGASNFHSFLSAGYGYDFTESWNVELGVNYGLKKWQTSSQTPIGAFIRVNYIFR